MTAGVLFRLGLLKRLENLVPNGNRISQALQSWRMLFKLIMSKVVMLRSRRQNQIVIVDRDALPVGVIDEYPPLMFIYPSHLRQDNGQIAVVPEYASDGGRNLCRRQNGGRNLIEKRLKQMMIVAVDQDNLDRRVLKSFSSG